MSTLCIHLFYHLFNTVYGHSKILQCEYGTYLAGWNTRGIEYSNNTFFEVVPVGMKSMW